MRIAISLTIAAVFFSLTSMAVAAEKRTTRAALPAAVQRTADEQSQGATVKSYSKDVENGKVEYEVELTVNGHSKDVTIAPDGSLLEVEEEVSIDGLSSQVRSSLEKKAGQGKLTKVESITKHGTLVAYEGHVLTAGKHSEVQVGPNGETLRHEE
jgi:uncharacterized membrane protein YkoI